MSFLYATQETFLQDFIIILKRTLQNYYKILKKCFLSTACVMCLLSASSNLQLRPAVTRREGVYSTLSYSSCGSTSRIGLFGCISAYSWKPFMDISNNECTINLPKYKCYHNNHSEWMTVYPYSHNVHKRIMPITRFGNCLNVCICSTIDVCKELKIFPKTLQDR